MSTAWNHGMIPQGSVLGSLLLHYIYHSTPVGSSHTESFLLDNICILTLLNHFISFNGMSSTSALRSPSSDFGKFQSWLASNKLFMNPQALKVFVWSKAVLGSQGIHHIWSKAAFSSLFLCHLEPNLKFRLQLHFRFLRPI